MSLVNSSFHQRLGNFLLRSMRSCLNWPAMFGPFKAIWLLLCLSLLKQSFMRSFLPAIESRYGFKLAGSPTDSVLNKIVLYRGVFEPVLSELITGQVLAGDICVDAGANVGYFTLLLAQRVGATGQVIAIEPAPRNLKRISRNLEMNGYTNRVDLVGAACSNFEGKSNFYVNAQNDMHNRLALPSKRDPDYWLMGHKWLPVEVNVKTLIGILGARASEVTFIKLDIEGAEHKVIPHILQHCTHHRLQVALEAKAPHIRLALEAFEKAGFLVYDLHNNYLWLLEKKVPAYSQTTYSRLYAKRYMVDVLVTRLPLQL